MFGLGFYRVERKEARKYNEKGRHHEGTTRAVEGSLNISLIRQLWTKDTV